MNHVIHPLYNTFNMQFLLLFYPNDLCRHSQTHTVLIYHGFNDGKDFNLNEIKSKRRCSEKRRGEPLI